MLWGEIVVVVAGAGVAAAIADCTAAGVAAVPVAPVSVGDTTNAAS